MAPIERATSATDLARRCDRRHVVFIRSAAVGMAVDRIAKGTGALEERRSGGDGQRWSVGRCRSRTACRCFPPDRCSSSGRRLAGLGVDAVQHVAFDAAIGPPVHAAVVIDPDAPFNLAGDLRRLLRHGHALPRTDQPSGRSPQGPSSGTWTIVSQPKPPH